MNLQSLETKLQYTFLNKHLLREALIHPSKRVENKNIATYQRLEFLGDKVLNFTIAHKLFTDFPSESEGEISKRHSYLVSGIVCCQVAEKIDILPYIQISNGQKETITLNKNKILEDALEAIIGAIYLDSNMENIQKLIASYWQDFFKNDSNPPKDSKSTLQEYYQKHYQQIPTYTIKNNGLKFIASLEYQGIKFSAEATTKKEAEKNVAQEILNAIMHP